MARVIRIAADSELHTPMPNLQFPSNGWHSVLLLVPSVWVFAITNVALATKPSSGALSPVGASLDASLADLLAVERDGVGNAKASRSWRQVAAADAAELPQVLAAIDGAGPLAANWIASAAEAIVERSRNDGDGGLPNARLREFVVEVKHAPRARRLAFEWLRQADPEAAEGLVPGFLHDRSPELRREAVARLLDQGRKEREQDASDEDLRNIYRHALSGACDLDQVRTVKAELEKLGEKVDLARHFGFIRDWKLIGPFDNTDEAGFDIAYPPEEKIDLAGRYSGKPDGGRPREIGWIDHQTPDEFGIVDLYKAIGRENGVAGYAFAEFWSDDRQEAELRLGRDNAAKIWLNGRLVHEHGVYHSGSEMDQYVGRGVLLRGRNAILVKVCQNEQKEDWAQTWAFQLRVCDSAGQAIHSSK